MKNGEWTYLEDDELAKIIFKANTDKKTIGLHIIGISFVLKNLWLLYQAAGPTGTKSQHFDLLVCNKRSFGYLQYNMVFNNVTYEAVAIDNSSTLTIGETSKGDSSTDFRTLHQIKIIGNLNYMKSNNYNYGFNVLSSSILRFWCGTILFNTIRICFKAQTNAKLLTGLMLSKLIYTRKHIIIDNRLLYILGRDTLIYEIVTFSTGLIFYPALSAASINNVIYFEKSDILDALSTYNNIYLYDSRYYNQTTTPKWYDR